MNRFIRLYYLSVLLFLSVSGYAQQNHYYRADSLMRVYPEKIKNADELYKVIYYIRTNFKEDSLRLRASFIWITENIAYDVKAFIKEDPIASQINYVIKNKKAVCGGYAALLKYFCDGFNIECEVVEGYARAGKNKVYMNQSYLRNNHAWNAVKINGNWRLIDATWGAGGVDESDEDNLVFNKNFKEVYYFTPPDKLILNHLPAKKQFQLTNKSMDQKRFMKAPLYLTDYLADSILSVLPDTALIKAKVGDTLVFKLKTNNNIQVINAFSDRIEKAAYTNATIYKDGWVEFHYPVKVIGTYNLYLENFITNRERYPLIAYRIEVN